MAKIAINDGAVEYDGDEQIGYLLRRAYQRHLSIFQENVTDSTITSVQFSLLCKLYADNDMSQSDLVSVTSIDQATIRGVISRLRSRHLISIHKDHTDGRKVIISITESGRKVVESMIPQAINITNLTYGGLNSAERVALAYLLKKII